MNRDELVSTIALKTGQSKSAVNEVIKAFVETVQDEVSTGGKVALVGFGTFERIATNAREGRNPQTGATVTIPAGFRPKFAVGATFKQRVNGGR